VTVAKEIELRDPLENMGAQMVREVASKTSTLLVTARPPRPCSHRLSSARVSRLSPPAPARPLSSAASRRPSKWPFAEIQRPHKDVKGDMIAQVGTISANNDKQIGGIIAEA